MIQREEGRRFFSIYSIRIFYSESCAALLVVVQVVRNIEKFLIFKIFSSGDTNTEK